MLPNRSGCEGFFGVAGVSDHGRIEDKRISAIGEHGAAIGEHGSANGRRKRLRNGNQLQIMVEVIRRNVIRTLSKATKH